ncbi:hypothetical protein ACIPY3_19370 [Paenarthrobacter sp. NPDC089714]|uniref:hypothetical protein n=1 Tax=Paenarthrobacter sp. NPDC089714 TaxID=3364377 RepID=UPI0038039DD6
MTTELWRPLGFENNVPRYDALHDGIPAWMEESFWSWMRLRLTITRKGSYNSTLRSMNLSLLRQVERICRIKVEYTNSSNVTEGMAFIRNRTKQMNAELVVADYLLADHASESAATDLELILEESGSKWRVGDRHGRLGLVQRVTRGVQDTFDRTMESSGHAGNRLAEAWEAAYGVSPNPSLAYSLAVKAVEDAAVPVVCPNDFNATLGKINAQLRHAGDWSLPLAREDAYATTSFTLVGMMKMLWAGQADRHGGNHDPDLVITQEAAEVAVTTAATLVQWFASGAVARRNSN